ncbi:MAG TPA: hypothetical protein PKC49_04685 [Phycisphaerae bacterium]|nr:hypothetical protein [Phycisphaerae bacterium]
MRQRQSTTARRLWTFWACGVLLALPACERKPTAPTSGQPSVTPKDHGHAHDHDHDHDDDHERPRPQDASHAGGQTAQADAGDAHGEAGHGHAHVAPRGGALITLGDHFAHLEVLLDAETGVLDIYVLDGEAHGAVRIAQETMSVRIEAGTTTAGGALASPVLVELHAVPSVLSGETVGDSSRFQGQADALRGLRELSGRLAEVTAKGQALRDVTITWPGGDH